MALNLASLNQRYNYLLSLVNGLIPSVNDIIARIIAVKLPPNVTTLFVDNTILLDETSSPNVNYTTLDNYNIIVNDTSSGDIADLSSQGLQVSNGTNIAYIQNNNIVVTDGTNSSNLNSTQVNCFNFTNGTFTQMDGLKFKISDLYGTIGITELNNLSLNFTDITNSESSSLSTSALTITGGGATSQIQALGGDFVINNDTNRLLMGNTQPSYWGDFSVGTHSEINQNVGGLCQIKLNSRFGTLTAGDADETNNKTTLYIEDSSRTIRMNAYDTAGGTGGKTQLNSVDILSNVGAVGSPPIFTLPINFTKKWDGGYSYNNPNNWELVRSVNMDLPVEYFTLSSYTAWKIDVAFNCWNMTNQTDKAYAMYLEFVDNNSTSYTGICFNQNTPFTTHRNSSTYTATVSDCQNYCWSDHIDFSGSSGGSFSVHLWRYADNPMSCDFIAIITLSKTNIL